MVRKREFWNQMISKTFSSFIGFHTVSLYDLRITRHWQNKLCLFLFTAFHLYCRGKLDSSDTKAGLVLVGTRRGDTESNLVVERNKRNLNIMAIHASSNDLNKGATRKEVGNDQSGTSVQDMNERNERNSTSLDVALWKGRESQPTISEIQAGVISPDSTTSKPVQLNDGKRSASK